MNFYFFLIKETLKGKTLFRILLDYQIFKNCYKLKGRVMDLGSGKRPYYHDFFNKDTVISTGDVKNGEGIDYVVDLEKTPLQFKDESFNGVLLFNVLCLLKNPENLLPEIYRILKQEGKFYFSSLLMIQLRPEPKDYNRWTSIKIKESLKDAGFAKLKIIPLGERFSVCVNLIISPLSLGVFNFLKIPFYFGALFFDRLIPRGVLINHPAPMGYFCITEK